MLAVTFWPSESPNVRAKVASISTRGTSWSRPDVFPLVPLIPSLLTIGASLRLLAKPVHPTNTDRCDCGAFGGFEVGDGGGL